MSEEKANALGAYYPGELALLLIPVDGKRPVGAGWNAEALARVKDGERAGHLRSMVERLERGGNVGLVIPPGWVCLDFDDAASAAAAETKNPGVPKQITAKGAHFFFLAPPGVEVVGAVGVELEPGVRADIRAGGKNQVVVAPSIHPELRVPYRWERSLAEFDPEPLPAEWIAAIAGKRSSTPKAAAKGEKGRIAEGARNQTLFDHGRGMRTRGRSQVEVEEELEKLNRACDPPLDAGEVKRIAASVAKWAPAPKLKGRHVAFEDAVAEMNEYAAVLPDNRIVYRRAGAEHFSEPTGVTNFVALSPRITYVDDDGEDKPVARAWIQLEEARTVDRVVRSRGLPLGFGRKFGISFVNTFVPPPNLPPPTEEEHALYVRPWLEMLEIELGEKDARTLVAVHAMHYQGRRPFYALVLAGGGGNGKGLLGALMGRVFEWRPGYVGMLNAKGTKEPRFFGAPTIGKIYVRCEEVERREVFDYLKDQMDRESAKEAKGKDAAMSANDAMLVLCTNSPECVPLLKESDVRRWALYHFGVVLHDKHPALVDRLDELLDSEECVTAWRAHLQHLRWRGVVGHKSAPETVVRLDMREAGELDFTKIMNELLGSEDAKTLPFAFTIGELTHLVNGRRMVLGQGPLRPDFVLSRILERDDVVRVEGRPADGRVKLRGELFRLLARGPERDKIAKLRGKELEKWRS